MNSWLFDKIECFGLLIDFVKLAIAELIFLRFGNVLILNLSEMILRVENGLKYWNWSAFGNDLKKFWEMVWLDPLKGHKAQIFRENIAEIL